MNPAETAGTRCPIAITERNGSNSTDLLSELLILSNFLKISSISGYHLPFKAKFFDIDFIHGLTIRRDGVRSPQQADDCELRVSHRFRGRVRIDWQENFWQKNYKNSHVSASNFPALNPVGEAPQGVADSDPRADGSPMTQSECSFPSAPH